VIGTAGDGKSSLITKACADGAPEVPKTGRNVHGVTKEVNEYPCIGFNGMPVRIVDTMGIGDCDAGLSSLIAGLKSCLENTDVDGVIVTQHCTSTRLGLAPQLIRKIIDNGMVSNHGVSPWNRIIMCGTQSDRAEDDDLEGFKEVANAFFEKCGIEPNANQIVTSSSKNHHAGGMSDLFSSMHEMGRHTTLWDPDYDKNGGNYRMSAAIADTIGVDADVFRMKLDVEMAWSKVQDDLNLGAKTTAGVATGSLIVGTAGYMGAEGACQYAVGSAISMQYGNALNTAAVQGSNQLVCKSGETMALTGADASMKAIGKELLTQSTVASNGSCTVNSTMGKFAVDWAGTAVTVSKSVEASAGLVPSLVGAGTEFACDKWGTEGMKYYKKRWGCGAQVGTAAAFGAAAGGPLGAGVGAVVGLFTWCSGQLIGMLVEKAILSAFSKEHPSVVAYYAAKARYEAAKEKVKVL
jgi:hypothetical protein